MAADVRRPRSPMSSSRSGGGRRVWWEPSSRSPRCREIWPPCSALVLTACMPPLIGIGGAVDRARAHPPTFRCSGRRLAAAASAVPTLEAPLLGTVIQPSSIGGAAATGLKNDLSLSGLAPVPSGISPATKSFLDHVVSSVLVPASLTALAAIAVPGVAGLLIVCVAGIRVGYRQAKAGLALRVSGIARFAGPGPMGVVRSGGLIALHTRTPRLGKPHATRAARREDGATRPASSRAWPSRRAIARRPTPLRSRPMSGGRCRPPAEGRRCATRPVRYWRRWLPYRRRSKAR